MASSSRDWAADLRAAIKQEFRLGGFTVREMRGKVFLQKRWPDGRRESAALPINWEPGINLQVLTAITAINGHIQGGMSLKDAAHLQWPVDGPMGPSTTIGINWVQIAERFKTHKVGSGQVKETTWDQTYARVIKQVLSVLGASSAPSSGKALLAELTQGAPGSRGRVVRIERAAQFLTFTVKEVGLNSRWLPPEGKDLKDLKGNKAPNETPAINAGQAVPLSDDAFLALLDAIPDQRWRLAVGLCGVFGLRPIELQYVRVDGDGLWCDYQKRTARGLSPKRHIEALDPVQRPGLARELLLTLSTGIVELPPMGNRDDLAAGALNTYLKRREIWQQLRKDAPGRLSAYSLRHGYAYRSAMTYNLPVRTAAALMGHSVQVHTQHYGKWVDAAGVKGAVEAARARVLTTDRPPVVG